jgi:hypothetical protein
MFLYALNSPVTRERYSTRLRYFFSKIGLEGKPMVELCRTLFASHLRQSGIQPDVMDLLQGQVSQLVLTRHHLVPQSSLKDQVLQALENLKQEIEQ